MSALTDAEIIAFFRAADWAAGILPEPRTVEDCRRVLRVEAQLAMNSESAVMEAYTAALFEVEEHQGANFGDYLFELHTGAEMLGTSIEEVLAA
ncbi:MAG: hypothetical protein K0R99_937 [Microbacterium sp.]|jgi:hypothetical protein|uniref:hypothetical protein n=1 Tax=Microbacterium sp. TaxID=51671 RepID=UPI002617BCBC|nr:hypothetical protein [Microbacterium sp.]MDF2559491.1 hypothetical protein [Microbacterium sp.]